MTEEKKEMTEEQKEEERRKKKLRYENMYCIKEYKNFFKRTEEGEELFLLLFNIYYQLTRIADHLREEQSPIN